MPPGAAGLYEARAGLLSPERCIEALLLRATANGATLLTDQAVLSWRAGCGAVEVRTATATYSAGALVIAAGAWAAALLPGLELPLRVERRVVHWFAPARNAGTTNSSSSNVVSITTRHAGARRRSIYSAAIPSTSGIRTSISTTSAASVTARSTASRPFAAVPTTAMPGWSASSEAMPSRISRWSSTTSTRTGGSPVVTSAPRKAATCQDR